MTSKPCFIDLPDGRGKLYVPQPHDCPGKHPCPDCFACQRCSPDRCAVCRPATPPESIPQPPEPDECH